MHEWEGWEVRDKQRQRVEAGERPRIRRKPPPPLHSICPLTLSKKFYKKYYGGVSSHGFPHRIPKFRNDSTFSLQAWEGRKAGTITAEASDSKRTRSAPFGKETGACFLNLLHMSPKLGIESVFPLQESEGQEVEDNHRRRVGGETQAREEPSLGRELGACQDATGQRGAQAAECGPAVTGGGEGGRAAEHQD